MITLSTKTFIDFKSYFFFQLVQNFNQLSFQKFVQNQHDLHMSHIYYLIYLLPSSENTFEKQLQYTGITQLKCNWITYWYCFFNYALKSLCITD